MPWYAASIIMYMKFKEGVQDVYPIWENVFLIEGKTIEEVKEKAKKIGLSEEGDDEGTTYYGDTPASWVFGGIRKIISCIDPEEQPKDGTEVTYSEFRVDDEDSLKKLINGETVNITYDE